MSKEHIGNTARHDKKKSGAKSAARKKQGKTTKGLFAMARRQVGNAGPVDSPLFAGSSRQIGSFTETKGHVVGVVPTILEPAKTDKDVCDSCGKTVRVRKDGALYSHACSS